MDSETLSLINIILGRSKVFLADAIVQSESTQRQVIYRLEKVNDFLQEKGLTRIDIGDNKEFIVTNEVRQFLLDYLYDQDYFKNYFLNKEERKHYIFLMLFMNKEYISVQHIIEDLKVSKSTFLQDIKDLGEELAKEDIIIDNDRIRGYHLIGSERSIRKNMINIILEYVSVKHNFRLLNIFVFNNKLESVDTLKNSIEKLSNKYEIVFVEDRLIEFIYIFILIKNRITNRKSSLSLYDDIPNVELMNSFKEYAFTKELVSKFFTEEAIKHEGDIQYLTSWILGSSVGDVEESSADLLVIGEMVTKILRRFEVVSSIKFEDIETMYRHIYSHFRPAYYRLLFRHPIVNPLTDTIKTEYQDLYKLVSETMRPISESLEFEIPNEELAYLTLHFLSQYKIIETSKRKKLKGLIVCLNGVGSSVILYNELKKMFEEIEFYKPLEASKVNPESYSADIIFTTHYFKELKDFQVPIVKVSPVMDSSTRYQVIQEARLRLGIEKSETQYLEGIMNVVKQHFGNVNNEAKLRNNILNVLLASKQGFEQTELKEELSFLDMISKQSIQINIEAKDWKSAIAKVGLPLVANGSVNQQYIDSILNMHESEISNFVITNNIAMPHTYSEKGGFKHAFSIGVLKDEIDFGYNSLKPVKYIFALSAPDNYKHINAMTEFLSLINDESFLNVLDNARNSEEIYEYIKSFLSN